MPPVNASCPPVGITLPPQQLNRAQAAQAGIDIHEPGCP